MPHWVSYTSYSLYFDGGDMAEDEVEFLLAVASFQKRFGRRYPTWLEVLHIARCLGYRKVADPVPIEQPLPPPAGSEARNSKPDADPVVRNAPGVTGDAFASP